MTVRASFMTGYRRASATQRRLFQLLGLLLLLALLLPVVRWESVYYPSMNITLGPAAAPLARLDNLGLIYKSDTHGTYAVLDAKWHLFQPLGPRDRLRYSLLKPDGSMARQIEVELKAKHGLTPQCQARGNCELSVASSIRVPEEDLASHYRLTAEFLRPDGPAPGFNSPQVLRSLPQQGFGLTHMLIALLLTLLLTGLLLRYLAPVARHNLRWRVFTSLLLANLAFLLLHAALVFQAGEFLVWAKYRIDHYYVSWVAMSLGWALCVLIGRSLYMGLMFTSLLGLGLLANFAKIAIYGIPIGGNDLTNLLSLGQILREEYPLLPWLLLGGGVLLVWRLRLAGWLLRCAAVTAAFFAFSVVATQASNKVLGYNINYFRHQVTYHRDIIRNGPSLYLFNLINDMVSGGTIFSQPLPGAPTIVATPPQPVSQPPAWDLVLVMQYEALWLGWQGGICAQPPKLQLPASIQQFQTQIRSPTTGGMTVLAEFEMNTGLPVGLLKQGIVPYYYLQPHVPGLAATAVQQGYDTTFIHPYKATFWGREKAIPALGYQQQHFEDDFTALDYKGLYVSDQALVRHILAQVDHSQRSQFIYAVTMQGHGPFNGPRYQQQERQAACADLPDDERQALNTYYTGVVDAMASLQHLLEALDRSGKRYLVLAFGDHQPYLMAAGSRVLPAKAAPQALYQIPLMAFTRADDSVRLDERYQSVRQLFQAGQVTRQLLRGENAALPPNGLLHPILGMEPGFHLDDYLPQIWQTFRADTLP